MESGEHCRAFCDIKMIKSTVGISLACKGLQIEEASIIVYKTLLSCLVPVSIFDSLDLPFHTNMFTWKGAYRCAGSFLQTGSCLLLH